MNYKLELKKNAIKFLEKHPKERDNFINAFRNIANGKEKNYDIKKLEGYTDFYRLRLGKYRAIYTIRNDELVIIVFFIGSRGDIYKSGV